MKKVTRLLILALAVILMITAFSSCNPKSTDTPKMTDTQKATLTFANTSMSAQNVEIGTSVSKPADPEKSGSIFGGWYTDSKFTTEVKFPIVVNSDTTIYAKFYNYKEAFQSAREKTLGDDVPGYAYTYTLNASATVSALSLSGKTEGNSKYSATGDVSFYDEHTNSGILFIDGNKYQIRRGTDLQKISTDENGKLTSYSVEQVDSSYKYDSSSFAKAVFTYSDDQLKSISPTSEKNVYSLKTSINASSAISIIGNYLNHPLVEKIIGELPATDVNTGMFVTFSDGNIDSYTYEMHINVSSLKFDLTYTLHFTDSGKATTIVPKDFPGIALSASDIRKMTSEASNYISTFKNKTQSGYDYTVKTGVDFGATVGEINSTFDGSAMRKIDDGTVYFHNDIEIDSDYKNSDLYKSASIDDVHVKLSRLSNGDVYLIEKKLLTDATQKIEGFTASENTSFYLFDVINHSGTYSFAEKEEKSGVTTYSFGITNSGAGEIFDWLNSSLDLDPLNTASKDVLVFGNIQKDSITANTAKLIITVKGGVLDGITVQFEGDATTSFPGSANFTAAQKAQIRLDYSIKVNTDGNTFEPFSTVKDAK